MKTEVKRELNVEEIKKIDDLKSARIPRLLCLLLFLTIVIVIAILSTAFIFYRVRTKQTKNSSSRKMKNDFDDDSSTVLELGTKSQKEKLVKESGIVILYVRESDQFMTLMSEFKKCLRKHTDCDVSKIFENLVFIYANVMYSKFLIIFYRFTIGGLQIHGTKLLALVAMNGLLK